MITACWHCSSVSYYSERKSAGEMQGLGPWQLGNGYYPCPATSACHGANLLQASDQLDGELFWLAKHAGVSLLFLRMTPFTPASRAQEKREKQTEKSVRSFVSGKSQSPCTLIPWQTTHTSCGPSIKNVWAMCGDKTMPGEEKKRVELFLFFFFSKNI